MFRHLPIGIPSVLAAPLLSAPAFPDDVATAASQIPAGEYRLDPSHASLIFRVNHLGFSHFTSQFRKFDAKLILDPKHPERSRVSATIDPRSIEIVDPKLAIDIQGPQWFDSARFPQIAFHSTEVQLTGPKSARITGELNLHGVTLPVSWNAIFNGGYGANKFDPSGARVGFSAHGALKRSPFGMGYGIPAPGSAMGVGDEVDFTVEAEFSHPVPKKTRMKQAGEP